jgi:hypothetical protein
MHGDKYGHGINDGVVVDMHNAPRFGHTSDFSRLFSSSEVDPRDYKTGILAFASLVVLFFFLWAGHLLILKIKGKKRVGCAAGQVYQADATHEAEEVAIRRESRLRCTFIMCLLSVLTACVVLLGSAVPTALDATAMLGDLIIDVQANIYEGMAISQSASRAQDQLEAVDLDVLMNATTYCPRATPENEDGSLFDILSKIEHSMPSITTAQTQIHHYTRVAEQDGGMNSDLEALLNVTMQVERYLDLANDYDYTAKLFVLVMCVLSAFFVYGLLLLRCDRSNLGMQRFLAYIIIPIFTLVILAGAVFTGAASSLAVMNADYCSGGTYPGSAEGTMEAVLVELGHTPGDIIYDAFVFYKEGCLEGDDPFDFLGKDVVDVMVGLTASSPVESYIESVGLGTVNEMCGEDIRPFLKSSQQLTEALQTAQRGLQRSVDFTSCSRVRPIYRRVFYGTTCQESVQGLTNIFASLVVITFFGMMLLSVRASLYTRDTPYPDQDVEKEFDEQFNSDEEYEQYKNYMSQYSVYDKYLKNTNNKDEDASGLDALAHAASTFDTESHEPGESWDDEEETTRAKSNLYADSPSARAQNEEELEPLSPPNHFSFSSPSADEYTSRPETAGSC